MCSSAWSSGFKVCLPFLWMPGLCLFVGPSVGAGRLPESFALTPNPPHPQPCYVGNRSSSRKNGPRSSTIMPPRSNATNGKKYSPKTMKPTRRRGRVQNRTHSQIVSRPVMAHKLKIILQCLLLFVFVAIQPHTHTLTHKPSRLQ